MRGRPSPATATSHRLSPRGATLVMLLPNSMSSARPNLSHVIAEIVEHALMAGIGGIVLVPHRQVVVAGGVAGRHQMGGLVDDAAVGGDIPQPAEVGLALQAIERDAALHEILGDGQSGCSGADDAVFVAAREIRHESDILYVLDRRATLTAGGGSKTRDGSPHSPRPSARTPAQSRMSSRIAAACSPLVRDQPGAFSGSVIGAPR